MNEAITFGVRVKIGHAKRCLLREQGTNQQANCHARKANQQRGMRDPFQSIERRKPLQRNPPAIFAALRLALEPPLLHEIKARGDDAKSQRRISGQKCADMHHQPAHAHTLRREMYRSNPRAGTKTKSVVAGRAKIPKEIAP